MVIARLIMRRVLLSGFLTCVVVGKDCEAAADDHKDDDNHGDLAGGFAGCVRRSAPLHVETVETDHAVKFSNEEEQINNPQPGMIDFEAGCVRSDIFRVHEHREHVVEHEAGKKNAGDKLNPPPGGIAVAKKFVVAAHNAEGLVVARELAQSKDGVNNNQTEDNADEDAVHPEMVNAVDVVAAREGDEAPEHVFAEKNGARKAHMAEKENTENQTGNALQNIAPCVGFGSLLRFDQVDAVQNRFAGRCYAVAFGDVFEIVRHIAPKGIKMG